MTDAALHIEGLTKSFGVTRALDSVSLTVLRGEVHALLGENGSGKSTLIKILSGYHEPDPGATLAVGGRPLRSGDSKASFDAGLRFVHQNLGLVETCSVADNLSFNIGYPTRAATIRQRRLEARAEAALGRVGLQVKPSTLLGDLSPAERTGVAMARALLGDDGGGISLLVLDEPTATLPENEVERLLDIVRAVSATGTGVLYVTHRLEEVFTAATTATVLRDGREVVTTPVAGLTRAALVNYLVGDEFDLTRTEARALPKEHGEPLLVLEDLRTSQIDGLSLTVGPGEVVGVAGITGSGREEICGAIFGATPRVSGAVRIDGVAMAPSRPDLCIGSGVAFIPANRLRDGGFPDLSARENICSSDVARYWRPPFLRSKAERDEAKQWFVGLHVRPAGGSEQHFSTFSGGNQQKLVFGKWLRRTPRLFLLDEPTQGVDVPTKAFLHHQLLQAAAGGAAVLVSSSDVDELVTLCQRVVVLRRGAIVTELSGRDINPARIARESHSPDEVRAR